MNVLNEMYDFILSIAFKLPKEVKENSINIIFRVHNFSIWRPISKSWAKQNVVSLGQCLIGTFTCDIAYLSKSAKID
jgi:hypothetical protein